MKEGWSGVGGTTYKNHGQGDYGLGREEKRFSKERKRRSVLKVSVHTIIFFMYEQEVANKDCVSRILETLKTLLPLLS